MSKLSLLVLIFTSSISFAQKKIIFTNSEPVDNKRYDDVKGSPMIFDGWVPGEIIDDEGVVYDNLFLNYNGYTEAFEVVSGKDQYIILNPATYTEVIITDLEARKSLGLEFLDSLVFKKSLHPKMKDLYVLTIFEGKGYQFKKYFVSNIVTRKKNIPGETVEFKRFNPKDLMILLDHGIKYEFTMKKSSMKKNLPLDYEINKWNKRKRKTDVYSYEGFVEFLKERIEKGK